jgi:hypothetical protein
MRASAPIAALGLLAACSSGGDDIRGEPIECAIGSAAELARECRLERIGVGEVARFIVHHPDGGFRRLELAPDGKGLAPSDGADEARNSLSQGMIDLSIGQDRYRIPADMVQHDGQP